MSWPRLALSLALVAATLGGGAFLTHSRATAREAAAEAAHPPLGRVIPVAGAKMHLLTQGDGPDLVLIHGASGNLRDFTTGLMPALTARYRVTVIDRPGHGYSRAAGGEVLTSPADQAALIRAALTEAGITRPLVLGHSYGGAVALALALDDPAAVAGLVILSGATMPWEGDLGLWYALNDSRVGRAVIPPLITAFAPPALIDRTVASIFAPDPPPPGYAQAIGPGLSTRRAALSVNTAQVNGLLPHVTAMAARYPALSLPVEVIHGTADTITPIATHARRLAPLLPDARLTELPGAGHMPHHTHPQAVIAAIDRAAARAALR